MKNIVGNIYTFYSQQLYDIVHSLYPEITLKPQAVFFERPNRHVKADLSTPIGIIIAKQLHIKPATVATHMQPHIESLEGIQRVEVAPSGFINVFFTLSIFEGIVKHILSVPQYGYTQKLQGKKAIVEYVSANPTGPLHIGHVRNGVWGDTMSNVLESQGMDVIREYYLNDAGVQVDVFGQSLLLHARILRHHLDEAIPKGTYTGEYMWRLAKKFNKKFGDKLDSMDEASLKSLAHQFGLDSMINEIKDELNTLGIMNMTFMPETTIINEHIVDKMIAYLTQKGQIYKGTLPPPKSIDAQGWEPQEQVLFRASNWGDTMDRTLQKHNKEWTYFSGDSGYHYHKVQRKPNMIVNIFGTDHTGHAKKLMAIVNAFSDGTVNFVIKFTQMVRVVKDGKPLKMSKRAGNVVLLSDLVDLIGKNPLRYFVLHRQPDVILDIDVDFLTSHSLDNPYFYVQYAYARTYSVLQLAKAMEGFHRDTLQNNFAFDQLSPEERKVINTLAVWPHLLNRLSNSLDVYLIPQYLESLAQAFHSLWTAGKKDSQLRFVIKNNLNLTKSHLAITESVRLTLMIGLKILGIEPQKVLE